MMKHILMIVTSHDRINEHKLTGLWFEEFAQPYAIFQREGYSITVASPKGGAAPIDPRSYPDPQAQTHTDVLAALQVLGQTVPLAGLQATDFDAVFLPGGHGTMFDLPQQAVGDLVGQFADLDKVIGAVCHGPAGLVAARRADGSAVVQGHRVTGFTNAEEDAAELTSVMPFLLQDKLSELGAHFVPAALWQDHVVVDRRLVTGQNPQSSASTAAGVVRLLQMPTPVR
jgi:putative intracellular protease/amidase